MCSKRAGRPSLLHSQPQDKLLSSSSSSLSPSSIAETPQRKRVKNLRRSTGPLSPEDLELAMTETQKEMNALEERLETEKEEVGEGVQEQETVVNGIPLSISILDREQDKEQLSQFNSTTSFPSSKMDNAFPERQTRTHNHCTCSAHENVNYGKLYELEKLENERMKERIIYLEYLLEEKALIACKKQKAFDFPWNSENDAKLVMERRIQELEEEVKIIPTLRANYQKVKEENCALIRVISKLSK